MKAGDLKKFLDDYLNVYGVEDYSMNGLQVGRVDFSIKGVAFCVDASLNFFKKALENKYNFLIVHHGLFWGENFPITGLHWERFNFLLSNKLSLYAAHLPLDLHPEIGHNAQMIKLLALTNIQPFGKYKGINIGFSGEFETPENLKHLKKKFDGIFGEYKLLTFGKKKIKSVAIVSGGAASLIPEAIEKGIDLYITGEPSHSMYHFIQEGKLNVLYGGHYKTETFGLLALEKIIKEKFKLRTKFFDIPTGF